MTHNGPAVSVSKRRWVEWRRQVKSGKEWSSIEAVMSEAWRSFCRHGTNWFGSWRNRGTNFMTTKIDSLCRSLIEAASCSIAVQFWSEPEICHDVKVCLRADAGVRVQGSLLLPLKQEQIAKTVIKFINTTVRVIIRSYLKLGQSRHCLIEQKLRS